MPPRALRQPLNLVVLGLLAERPRHAYDMRVAIRERGHDQALKIKHASLYDAVRRLANAELIEAAGPIRDSALPERTEYHLTAAGEEHLRDWVRELLAEPSDDRSALVAALSFMFALPTAEVVERLRRRAVLLAAWISQDDARLAAAVQAGVPEIFLSEHDLTQALRRAEHVWILALAEKLDTREGTS